MCAVSKVWLFAEASEPKTIELGVAGQWDDVLPRYKAYKGNTFHRDHSGRYNKYYTDNTAATISSALR